MNKRTAVVFIAAAGLSTSIAVGCNSSISDIAPTAPATSGPAQPAAVPGMGPGPTRVAGQPVNGVPSDRAPIPGVLPPAGPVGPIPGVSVEPSEVHTAGVPSDGDTTSVARPNVPIPGVSPAPLPPVPALPPAPALSRELTDPSVPAP
jgi:hypothetical protein